MTVTLLHGNAIDVLQTLPSESVQCVVTSPPYYGLRDYKTEPVVWGGDGKCTHEWGSERVVKQTPQRDHAPDGSFGDTRGTEISRKGMAYAATTGAFCQKCGAWRGHLGLEPTPEMYVSHLLEVFTEVKRVLRKDGTFWLNLGDSYAGSWGNSGHRPELDQSPSYQREKNTEYISRGGWDNRRERPPSSYKLPGLKEKDLVGIPWRVAFALQADGWWLRSDIVWAKKNPMPESVRDRPTRSHEYVFLLTKSGKYFYDSDAIKEPVTPSTVQHLSQLNFDNQTGGPKDTKTGNRSERRVLENLKKSYRKQDEVGKRQYTGFNDRYADSDPHPTRNRRDVWFIGTKSYRGAHFATFPPDLVEPCVLAGSRAGDIVLDPFAGSGTVGEVCVKTGRDFIGIDLNETYIKQLAPERIGKVKS